MTDTFHAQDPVDGELPVYGLSDIEALQHNPRFHIDLVGDKSFAIAYDRETDTDIILHSDPHAGLSLRVDAAPDTLSPEAFREVVDLLARVIDPNGLQGVNRIAFIKDEDDVHRLLDEFPMNDFDLESEDAAFWQDGGVALVNLASIPRETGVTYDPHGLSVPDLTVWFLLIRTLRLAHLDNPVFHHRHPRSARQDNAVREYVARVIDQRLRPHEAPNLFFG